MVRKLALTLASLALSTSTNVYALGLGDIELHSALNQPLNADIKLTSVHPGELEGMQVELASSQAFQQAGLDRPQWLSQFKFKVDKNASGQPRIKVTSSQPVREPFVTFLVEVNWASGRMVREYTLLLDPPEFATGRQEAVPVPVVPAAPAKPVAPRAEETRPAAPDPAAAPAPAAGKGQSYGPVRPADTLWSIANQLRPDPSLSVEQMMLALVRANPEAFEGGNVNRLKKGYVLRVPDAADAAAIDRVEALSEVRRQNAAWSEYRRGGAAAPAESGTAAPAPAPAPAKPAAPVEEPAGPRLKLVPPAPEKPQNATAGAPAATAEKPQQPPAGEKPASLQQQLALANETVAARQQENDELRTRLAELEGQIANIQRLIQIKDNEIAALQSRLQAMQTGAAETPIPAAAPQQAQAPTAAQQPKPVSVEAPAEQAEPAAGGLMADLLSNPLVLLLGTVAALLTAALAWVAARRRRMMDSGFQESILMPQSAAASAPVMAASPAVATTTESTSFLNDSMITDVGAISAEVDESDPLAEADIYIAYGRYRQAEELIGRALEKEPQRPGLLAKMLEIHFATKDKASFETVAQELRTALGEQADPLWDKTVAMGRELCPENRLFGGVAEAGSEGGSGTFAGETEVSAGLESLTEEDFAFENPVAEAPSDNVMDFDLDFTRQEPEAEPQATALAVPDLGMEFETAPAAEEAAPVTAELALESRGEALEADNSVLEFDFDKADLAWSSPAPADVGMTEPEAAIPEIEPASWQEPERKEEGDLLSAFDEVGTKLDLAKVYIDMGDADSARSILTEVLEEGSEHQKKEAQDLLLQVA